MLAFPVRQIVKEMPQKTYRSGEFYAVAGLQYTGSDQLGRRFGDALKVEIPDPFT